MANLDQAEQKAMCFITKEVKEAIFAFLQG